ncbi:retrovirus-related Pol polyprotein from transposon 17.6 [Trichonephila clavipes]|nr:retrovirus-related Pol polyprotein from transposon 17.6 [Trichonephila clavipes]
MLNFYRRFLPHAAEAQAPLNKLLTNCKKNDKRPVPWNEEAETAFMQCKSSLANVATLNYPTLDQQLCLLVDASNSAVGDLVGPFPPSDGFTFLLTCIDRYTRWPEDSFIANWISRFGVPAIITTDQGGQFQSRLLYILKQMLGIQRIRTTPYHPFSNGMVERLHRTLKQAIRCHDTKWTESLPVVLLGLRACIKEDLNATCAEMVFGKTIVLSGEFFEPSDPN